MYKFRLPPSAGSTDRQPAVCMFATRGSPRTCIFAHPRCSRFLGAHRPSSNESFRRTAPSFLDISRARPFPRPRGELSARLRGEIKGPLFTSPRHALVLAHSTRLCRSGIAQLSIEASLILVGLFRSDASSIVDRGNKRELGELSGSPEYAFADGCVTRSLRHFTRYAIGP